MNIQHKSVGSKGMFYVEVENKKLAEMTYSKAGDELIIIDHTEVDESLKGKGVGKQLVAAAVKHARENHLKILPLCPFANAVFEKTPEFQDVLR